MKKLLIFFLFVHAISFALLRDDFKSINNVLDEPYRDWYLTVWDDKIIKTNLIERIYYRSISFVSSYHKKDLQKALISSIEKIQKIKNPYEEEGQKIIIEKICRLLSLKDENVWFGDISIQFPLCNKKQPNFVKKDEHIQTNLMQPFQKNGYFYNDIDDHLIYSTLKETKIYLRSIFTPSTKIDLNELCQNDPPLSRSNKLNIQWLGHSSFLVQVEGLNILLDPTTEPFHPLFGSLIKCFRRYTCPGISLKKMPKIDLILISHNHFDHLEDRALLYLQRYQPQILVPEGLKSYFFNLKYKDIQEFFWWNSSTNLENKISIYCVPARHNSMSRAGIDRQQSLWCGWIIETKNKRIYFAGDTAFDSKIFSQIRDQFGPIDVALLPIAPERMKKRHMDHKQALKAFEILKAKFMIPMHWGAYRTGDEKIEDPYLYILQAKEEDPKLQDKLKIMKIGERLQID